MDITGSTKLTGLFGYPVSHTISPGMHNAAFRHLKLDIVYLPFSIEPKNIEGAIKSLIPLGFIGINVTVPYKQTVMKYLDEIAPSAKMIGAVNTILARNNKLIGYNTDGMGFVRSLREGCNYKLKGKTMFLLGAGGAGRAVAIQSYLSGIKNIFICDKMRDRVKDLVKSIPGNRAISIFEKNDIKGAIKKSDIIVNATPIGLHSDDPISIPVELIPKGKLVYDVIYNPSKTRLLKQAKGCKTVNGIGMLLYQGASAFSIWTGKKAPIEVMREAVETIGGAGWK